MAREIDDLQKEINKLILLNPTITIQQKVFYEIIKRITDLVFATMLLPIAFTLVLIFGILVRLETPGSIFYIQTRVGKNGKIIRIYKIRSMYKNAENGCPCWATKGDPRVTKIGKIIRKTRIDELPQLINIIKGDLTFIGPRPERPELVLEFTKTIPNFIDRSLVKPGLTGLAQVNGGYEMLPDEKLKWDIKYIEKRSLLMDFLILFKTVWVVFTGKGAY